MSYRVYLDAIQCKRDISYFMRACDLGISDVGVPVNISFTTEQKPTDEYINKVIETFKKTEDSKDLSYYLTCIKLNRIEVVK